jgi:hypothetical protein
MPQTANERAKRNEVRLRPLMAMFGGSAANRNGSAVQ